MSPSLLNGLKLPLIDSVVVLVLIFLLVFHNPLIPSPKIIESSMTFLDSKLYGIACLTL